jgi:phosphohistidine phosphatase SixA
MKIYLVHHANAFTAKENPDRPLTELGEAQADRVGRFLRDGGVKPARILHSDKLWTRQTAERVAAVLGALNAPCIPPYDIMNDAAVDPFVADVANGRPDIVMTGHSEFLQRAGSKLVCGDEFAAAIDFKPGNAALFCLEGEGDKWWVSYALRQEHMSA